MHKIDIPERYNYQVNFSFLDELSRLDNVILYKYDIELLAQNDLDFLSRIIERHQIDLVVGPLRVRWENSENLPSLIKKLGLPLVIFDNDSFQFDFNDEFYSYFDWIFYREYDKNNDSPKKGSFLPWSLDADLYTPNFGGKGAILCASIGPSYPTRLKIKNRFHPYLINCSQYIGMEYIKHLQSSLISINTSRKEFNLTAAKLLETAACGTAILTEQTKRLDLYFDRDHLFIFNNLDELAYYIHYAFSHLEEVIHKQRMLRNTIEKHHTNEIRAREVLEILKREIF